MRFNSGVRVDLERFWRPVGQSAEIGKGRPGGLSRLSLTDSGKAMRDLLVAWCEETGLAVTVDELGNIFARRDGVSDGEKPILIGSHLDTQVNGGRFDGVVGVLAGFEVCRTLDDVGHMTKRPIVVVNWTNEEGARFSPPMVASGCFTGRYTAEWVRDRIADDGCRFGDELERIGYRGQAPCGNQAVDACFELHIEQGPLLGVVVDGLLVHGMLVEFTGETAHTGSWPMEKRRNVLVAGARWLTAVAAELSAPDDRTIRFCLNKPFPLLSYALGKMAAPMCATMPARIAGGDPDKPITEMVGSGTFSPTTRSASMSRQRPTDKPDRRPRRLRHLLERPLRVTTARFTFQQTSKCGKGRLAPDMGRVP